MKKIILSSIEQSALNELVKAQSRNKRLMKGLNDAWDEVHDLWFAVSPTSGEGTPESEAIKKAMLILETAIADAEKTK